MDVFVWLPAIHDLAWFLYSIILIYWVLINFCIKEEIMFSSNKEEESRTSAVTATQSKVIIWNYPIMSRWGKFQFLEIDQYHNSDRIWHITFVFVSFMKKKNTFKFSSWIDFAIIWFRAIRPKKFFFLLSGAIS